jgi:outer membrane protein TolC
MWLKHRQTWYAFIALAGGLLTASAAEADILPWLSEKLADPFAVEKKVTRMIPGNLRPDGCPGNSDTRHLLHFNDVVIAALCHNPDARAAYLTLLAQASTYATSYAAYLPTVTGNAADTRTTTFIKNGITSAIGRSYGVSAGLTLYDFGQREFKLEGAEQALIAAGYSYDSTLQGMIATALQGYFSLLTAQNGIDAAQESESYAKQSYEAAALRHQIGLAPLADALQAKGAWSQTRLATATAVNQLSQQQAALALLMGLPADTPIKVAEMDSHALMRDPFTSDVQTLIAQAKQKRNDLQASRAQLEESKIALEALKRADLATLSVNTSLNQDGNNINILHGLGATRTQAIGLSVSIPIFTGFSQTYNERATEEQLEAQEDELTRTELTVAQDVWNSWHNYETAKRSWETSRDLLASTTQLKDVALGRYKEGLGTILDVLNAQSQYTSALQSQLQTRYNLLAARVDLVRAAGVLDLDTMRPDRATDLSDNPTLSP